VSDRPAPAVTRLADGRELLWFDDVPGRRRTVVDRRPSAARPFAAELRHDPLVDEPVAVAAHRQDRAHLPDAAACPLCPSTPDRLTEVPEPYDVVVFENRWSSFGGAPAPVAPRTEPAAGRCEVVCFTADHDGSFGALPPQRLRTLVEAWCSRTEALTALPDVAHVFPFENRGVEIGVTLHHPHGQVYAFPFVPPRAARLLAVATRHRAATGRCVACDNLGHELAGPRVVDQTEHWVAYVPEAARWPYEAHVVPRRHLPDLPALTDGERSELGPLLASVTRRLDAVFGFPAPYMAGFFQAPAREGREESHLRWQLASTRRAPDKLKFLASSESLMGAFVNDVVPERAAAALREAVP
jgi:UDPglucose--hexose-1-phosphate uridylyltransferase